MAVMNKVFSLCQFSVKHVELLSSVIIESKYNNIVLNLDRARREKKIVLRNILIKFPDWSSDLSDGHRLVPSGLFNV